MTTAPTVHPSQHSSEDQNWLPISTELRGSWARRMCVGDYAHFLSLVAPRWSS
jgi:hypothetical protein